MSENNESREDLGWWQSLNHVTRQLLFILIVMAIFSAMTGALLSNDWEGFALFLGIELFGAVVTFVLFDYVLTQRDNRRLLNCQLIPRMRSQVNSVALVALNRITQQGWLYDGSLQGAYLSGANLKSAYIRSANLREAIMVAVNFQEATLHRCDLRGAHLWRADLRKARLIATDLQDAILQEAYLEGAQFDEETILPDGSTWTEEADLTRFTDPKHPEFWQREYQPNHPSRLVMPPEQFQDTEPMTD